MFPSPPFAQPVPLRGRPSWVNDQDHQHQQLPLYHHRPEAPSPSRQGHEHIPTPDSQFNSVDLNTPVISGDDWQYQYSDQFDSFNTGAFYYRYNPLHFFPQSARPSDQYDTVMTHFDYHDLNLNTGVHQRSVYNATFETNVAVAGSETHQQYHWAKQTGSEHDLTALAGQNQAAYMERHLPISPHGQYPLQVPSDSYPLEEHLFVPPITVPSQRPIVHPTTYYTLSPIDTDPSYYRPPAYQRSPNLGSKISRPVKEERDGPCMDHLPFLEGDEGLLASLSRTESQTTATSTLTSDSNSGDISTEQTLTTDAGKETAPAHNLPVRPKSERQSPPISAAECPSSPHQETTPGTNLQHPSSPRPVDSLSRTHELRPLKRRRRSSSPRETPYPSRPSTRSSQVSSGRRQPERKPPLACLFCRARKIACGPPPQGSKDHTCNQCARRSLKCEYPTESRRGMRRKKAILVTEASASGSHSPHKA